MEIRQEIEKIVEGVGTLVSCRVEAGKALVKIALPRGGAALAKSLRRAVDERITEMGLAPLVVITAQKQSLSPKPEQAIGSLSGVGRIVLIASGKGGVGKSSVAAALARSLAARGQRVGVLDADIYGPSQPSLFGLEGVKPIASDEGVIIAPISVEGIKVCSIGFFIDPADALVWRGPMATSALRQLITQTQWGELDTLVVDLPPGTGDVHLTVCDQLKVSDAVIVTTPSDLALSDVVRGIKMLRNDNIAIHIEGIVVNMAYFTPDDAPERRYYIFGDLRGVEQLAEKEKLPILAQIPIAQQFGQRIDYKLLDNLLR